MNEFGVPGGNGRIAPNTNRQTARLSGCGRPWLTRDNKIIDWALRARLERHLHNALLVTKAGDRITREERCQESGPVQTFESDTATASGIRARPRPGRDSLDARFVGHRNLPVHE